MVKSNFQKLKEIIGLLFGLIGGLVLLEIWNFSLNQLMLSGNLLFLLAALVWAFITIVSQQSKTSLSPITFSLYLYGFSSIFDFILAFNSGIFEVFNFSICKFNCKPKCLELKKLQCFKLKR